MGAGPVRLANTVVAVQLRSARAVRIEAQRQRVAAGLRVVLLDRPERYHRAASKEKRDTIERRLHFDEAGSSMSAVRPPVEPGSPGQVDRPVTCTGARDRRNQEVAAP